MSLTGRVGRLAKLAGVAQLLDVVHQLGTRSVEGCDVGGAIQGDVGSTESPVVGVVGRLEGGGQEAIHGPAVAMVPEVGDELPQFGVSAAHLHLQPCELGVADERVSSAGTLGVTDGAHRADTGFVRMTLAGDLRSAGFAGFTGHGMSFDEAGKLPDREIGTAPESIVIKNYYALFVKGCYNTLMLVAAFVRWWYGPGWHDVAHRLSLRMRGTYQNLSVGTLLRTMFEPWRRIISYSDGALGDRLRAVVDNAVSRCVGFSVRLIVLITAAILLTIYVLLGGLIVVLWPLLPLLGLGLIAGGLL